MRVLERCIPSAAPEVKVQIDALRQAFSNDISHPFELKPDLGLRSPSVESKPTPPGVYNQNLPAQGGQVWPQMQDPLSSKTLSPSSEYGQSAFQQPPVQPTMPFTTSGFPAQGQAAYNHHGLPQISTAPAGFPLEPVISNEQQQTPVWDPSGIFSQWNNAFGPPSQPQQTPPAQQMQHPTSAPAMPPQQHQQQQQQQQSPQHVYSQQLPAGAGQSMMPTVTPVMWQNAFTDAYVSGHGHKRVRDDGADGYGGYQKRRG